MLLFISIDVFSTLFNVLLLVICNGAFISFVHKECNTIKQDGIPLPNINYMHF
jgi:hypothetical protein